MTTYDITTNDEEKMLSDKLSSAKMNVERIKSEITALTAKRRQAEKCLADIEQACIDYMTGNGLIESELLVLKKSRTVDAPDTNAIPDKYLRFKTVIEPDKRKIAEHLPEGNWYQIKESYYVQLKADKSTVYGE